MSKREPVLKSDDAAFALNHYRSIIGPHAMPCAVDRKLGFDTTAPNLRADQIARIESEEEAVLNGVRQTIGAQLGRYDRRAFHKNAVPT